MSEEPQTVEKELDFDQALETDKGTFVVVGVQEVNDPNGDTRQYNYLITRPENVPVKEEE